MSAPSSELKNIVEAVLLAAEEPISVAKIRGLFDPQVQPAAAEIAASIAALQQECEQRGVELKKIGGGYRYCTREKYAGWIRNLYATRPPKLSRALLETLAIVAYRQPVSRGDIEAVRGVGVSVEIMQKLQQRQWVKQVGVRELPGRPALFGTTAAFLHYFNLTSLKDLPPLTPARELGELAREMEIQLPELTAADRMPSGAAAVDSSPPTEQATDAQPPADGQADDQSGEVDVHPANSEAADPRAADSG